MEARNELKRIGRERCEDFVVGKKILSEPVLDCIRGELSELCALETKCMVSDSLIDGVAEIDELPRAMFRTFYDKKKNASKCVEVVKILLRNGKFAERFNILERSVKTGRVFSKRLVQSLAKDAEVDLNALVPLHWLVSSVDLMSFMLDIRDGEDRSFAERLIDWARNDHVACRIISKFSSRAADFMPFVDVRKTFDVLRSRVRIPTSEEDRDAAFDSFDAMIRLRANTSFSVHFYTYGDIYDLMDRIIDLELDYPDLRTTTTKARFQRLLDMGLHNFEVITHRPYDLFAQYLICYHKREPFETVINALDLARPFLRAVARKAYLPWSDSNELIDFLPRLKMLHEEEAAECVAAFTRMNCPRLIRGIHLPPVALLFGQRGEEITILRRIHASVQVEDEEEERATRILMDKEAWEVDARFFVHDGMWPTLLGSLAAHEDAETRQTAIDIWERVPLTPYEVESFSSSFNLGLNTMSSVAKMALREFIKHREASAHMELLSSLMP